jgi:hypothetical protein
MRRTELGDLHRPRVSGSRPQVQHSLAAGAPDRVATAGRDGRFKLSLPPGSYRVTGRSPLVQSGQMMCAAAAELHVSRGQPARSVTEICSIP